MLKGLKKASKCTKTRKVVMVVVAYYPPDECTAVPLRSLCTRGTGKKVQLALIFQYASILFADLPL